MSKYPQVASLFGDLVPDWARVDTIRNSLVDGKFTLTSSADPSFDAHANRKAILGYLAELLRFDEDRRPQALFGFYYAVFGPAIPIWVAGSDGLFPADNHDLQRLVQIPLPEQPVPSLIQRFDGGNLRVRFSSCFSVVDFYLEYAKQLDGLKQLGLMVPIPTVGESKELWAPLRLRGLSSGFTWIASWNAWLARSLDEPVAPAKDEAPAPALRVSRFAALDLS